MYCDFQWFPNHTDRLSLMTLRSFGTSWCIQWLDRCMWKCQPVDMYHNHWCNQFELLTCHPVVCEVKELIRTQEETGPYWIKWKNGCVSSHNEKAVWICVLYFAWNNFIKLNFSVNIVQSSKILVGPFHMETSL